MYHLVRTKSKVSPFQVVLVGENGEPLSTSQLLKTKQAAKKNVLAQLNASGNLWAYVQDDTGVKPNNYVQYNTGQTGDPDPDAIKPKYIPGINPKKKK